MPQPTSLTPITREAVPLAVARVVQDFIAKKGLQAGSRLPSERELAEILQVSRSAVREGLKYLAALDVLTIRQGAGVFVVRPQLPALTHLGQLGSRNRLKMLRQATLARRLVDVEIAGRAAARITKPSLKRLEGYVRDSESEPLATLREHQLDLGFERLIAEIVDDPYLQVLQRQAHKMFQEAWSQCGLIPRPVAERNQQHRRIVEAISRGDEALARRRMEEHFSHSLLATTKG